ncbi:MAG: UDP-3-O-(3-hydroxymyristoyl)glucosamine N-acyltransferase [Planctomycetaceae bacterium]|jgi:UDP-3-O-[3-hydroxymyristoyl] glucosamine N-acyltransferase|nr:UDP-3-O-(3-hydroxymyristoyl)glucosamine N-acyltransferase [Planctomycetaceae bacterium]
MSGSCKKSELMKSRTVAELAGMISGEIRGNGDVLIEAVAPIQSATPTDITFLERADRKSLLKKCEAGAVIVPLGFDVEQFPTIQVSNVVESFKKIVNYFSPLRDESVIGISERASIHSTVKIGEGVGVGDFAVLEADVELGDNVQIHSGVLVRAGSKIGSGSIIFPNAVLYRDTIVGKRVIIHSSAVIGAFGFGYDSSGNTHKLSPQLGNVVIGDDVEIGSCSTIDRATYGSTIIGEGTKIDNLVMIAHNCKLGKHNLICAHTGIAGSTTTGDYVTMAGRVGVRDHVHIGEHAILGAMAGIMNNVAENANIVGIPATPVAEQFRIQSAIAKLPEMRKEFRALQKLVEKLNDILQSDSNKNQ